MVCLGLAVGLRDESPSISPSLTVAVNLLTQQQFCSHDHSCRNQGNRIGKASPSLVVEKCVVGSGYSGLPTNSYDRNRAGFYNVTHHSRAK